MYDFDFQLTLSEPSLLVVTEYLIGGAQRCQPWALSMILQALGAVVYENVGHLSKVLIQYSGPSATKLESEDISNWL